MDFFEIENVGLYCKINGELVKIAIANAEVEITPEFIF